MFEVVNMTHVCQYWRSTLISYPHLWSSIFVKNDHRDFVSACLTRSRGLPLTVHLDLKHGDDHDHSCTCIGNEWSSGTRIDEKNPCRYHTTIDLLDHTERIRTLDVDFSILDNFAEEGPDQEFNDALNDFGLFSLALPALESFSFRVDHEFDLDTHLELPRTIFFWVFLPPTKLRHLSLRRCYGGPIQVVRNLTSFELVGDTDALDPIELDQDTFLPFISGSPSLESLSLTHCSFPDRAQLSRVTRVRLPDLKSLRLMDIHELSGFPGLVDVPAIKTLSSLRISVQKNDRGYPNSTQFLLHAGSDDGFQLFYSADSDYKAASEWLDITYNADPTPALVLFEGKGPNPITEGMATSPLPLFVNAKVLEIGAFFVDLWYTEFWKDLEKVGPQLTTLRLEVTEGMRPEVVGLVERLARARFRNGTPLAKLERMNFEGVSEEDEEKAKKLWEQFRAGLNVDEFLAAC